MALPKIIQIPEGDEGALQYHYKRLVLTSAQILTSFATPIEIVAAPGAGKILAPIFAIAQTNYGTITYATNTSLYVYWNSVLDSLGPISLARTEDYIQILNDAIAADVLAIFENQNLTLKTQTGNPTAGDGTLTVYLWYIILLL